MKYKLGLYGPLTNGEMISSDKDGITVIENGDETFIPSDWIIHEAKRLYKPKNVVLPWYARLWSRETIMSFIRKYA